MPYLVTCPKCKEKNIGSAFRCVKCDTDLIGIPRENDSLPEQGDAFQQKAVTASSDVNKRPAVESVLHAIWRTLRSSLVIALLAILITAFICWSRNMRALYDFGNALFYTGTVLVFIGWFIFNGNQQLVRSQTNPLNPMNKVMPGTHLERTRQYWLDYLEGMMSVSVIGVSAAL